MSIIANINALKARLQNAPELNAFFVNNFGKALKVVKAYKNRTEIAFDDLPILMITRPQIDRSYGGSKGVNKEHHIFLYVGFHYDKVDDLELALDYFVELDDLLEDAVSTRLLSVAEDKAFVVSIEESANDEGMLHPIYFMKMHLKIKDR